MLLSRFSIHALMFAGLAASTALAQVKPTEVAGGKDYPLVSRYEGSVLQDMAQESFAQIRVPASPGRLSSTGLAFDKAHTVEGHVSGYFYIMPKGRSALEVFRNYQSALSQARFSTLYSCEMQACDQAGIRETFANEVVRPRKWVTNKYDPVGSIDRDVRFLSAKSNRNGTDLYVMLYVAEPNSIWQAPAAVLLVAEPAPMEGGKVVVNAETINKALAEEGKIALYGIYFDTGKAELKPDSKPQLEEMARLLQKNPSLKAFIVGHTDNQGSVDMNLTLSQQRAEAVIASLTRGYKIDAARLRARGLASFAPVTSNANEAGRAKNRRVELVEQ